MYYHFLINDVYFGFLKDDLLFKGNKENLRRNLDVSDWIEFNGNRCQIDWIEECENEQYPGLNIHLDDKYLQPISDFNIK